MTLASTSLSCHLQAASNVELPLLAKASSLAHLLQLLGLTAVVACLHATSQQNGLASNVVEVQYHLVAVEGIAAVGNRLAVDSNLVEGSPPVAGIRPVEGSHPVGDSHLAWDSLPVEGSLVAAGSPEGDVPLDHNLPQDSLVDKRLGAAVRIRLAACRPA